MFFCRHDGSLLTRARRRVKSSRAAVFAEFCFIAPLLVMLISGMIEIAGYFDARVMANHTAWTIGRQATVHMEELTTADQGGVITTWHRQFQQRGNSWAGTLADKLGTVIPACKNLQDHGKITAVMLMATCGLGYYGSTSGADLGELLKEVLVESVKQIFMHLRNALKEQVTDAVKNSLFPRDFSTDGWLAKRIANMFSDWLFKLILDPIIGKFTGVVSDKIAELTSKIDISADGSRVGRRRFRQIYGAARRAAEANPPVYSIDHLGILKSRKDRDAYAESKDYLISSRNKNVALDFPATFNKETSWKDYNVKGYYGWPPPTMQMSLLRVNVAWPYERGWLFPVVSGFRKSGAPVTASGSSLVFPQPQIDNDFLKSEGAKTYPYDEKADALQKALDAISKDARQYLRAMVFALKYRLRVEDLRVRTHNCERGSIFRWVAFCAEVAYCWFDEERIVNDETGSHPPWGDPDVARMKIHSHLKNTIHDRRLGYYQTCERLGIQTLRIGWDPSIPLDERMGYRNRKWHDQLRWFFWHNVDDGGCLRSRYFHPDEREFRPLHVAVSEEVRQSWVQSRARMRKFQKVLLVYLKELEDQIEGKGDSNAGGPANLINFDDLKDVDLNDVEAVSKYFRKKWQEMRAECEKLYEKLDALVSKQQDASEIVLTHAKDLIKYVPTPFTDENERRKKEVKEKRRKAIAENAEYVYHSFEELKNAECRLCGILGSKSAQEDKDIPFDQIADRGGKPLDEGKDPNPFRPGNDTGGGIDKDEWKWTKGEGWK